MTPVKIIDVKQSILEENNRIADETRSALKKQKTFLLNLMSAPGAGKTRLVTSTIRSLESEFRIGVMEADIESDIDAKRVADTGARTIQLHTGGLGHMDAEMTRQGLVSFDTSGLDLVILENIGSLVMPAEIDIGAVKNAMILSVSEGDDKPVKYPLMFRIADIILINKIDILPYFDFDYEKVVNDIHRIRPGIPILPVSALSGDGMDRWISWLRSEIRIWKDPQ
ncbi:MAG: hydrogenase nickel incorporation protein HypB [Lachnospiraceae bacterium]|jgi:hydrogenase nickel incorporation protein HypB|nr:hydrogenase nickel incorporation protein HypB [Lachnospiraceae bacterium]MCI1328427.1 hydrogenase nickel incorporation protein HypB [Lachnospiraceae bacterium]